VDGDGYIGGYANFVWESAISVGHLKGGFVGVFVRIAEGAEDTEEHRKEGFGGVYVYACIRAYVYTPFAPLGLTFVCATFTIHLSHLWC